MGKLPPEMTVDGVIAREPREVLRRHGFRGRSRTFHRRRGDFVHSVWFQTFRGMPFGFCVNLTVIHPFHHEIHSGRPLPTHPNAENSVFLGNTSVELDAPQGKGSWWVLEWDMDASMASAPVARGLEDALPWFDRWPESTASLLENLEQVPCDRPPGTFDLPVLLAAVGETERALRLLEDLLPDELREEITERIRQRGSRSGDPSRRAR